MKTDVRFDEYGFEIFNLNHDFRPFTYGKEKLKKNLLDSSQFFIFDLNLQSYTCQDSNGKLH
jgi:hypothetical protein